MTTEEWPGAMEVLNSISEKDTWKTITHVREKLERRSGKLIAIPVLVDRIYELEQNELIKVEAHKCPHHAGLVLVLKKISNKKRRSL